MQHPKLTHSYAAGQQDVKLIEDTVSVNLHQTVEKFPENIALIDAEVERQWTYRQFLNDVQKLATGLYRSGVKPGEGLAFGLKIVGNGSWSNTQPQQSVPSWSILTRRTGNMS